jgi:DME family drug/metabolite transporter
VSATTLPASTTSHIPLRASLMALAAGVTWSLGAVTARTAHGMDAWQYLVWRSVGVIVVMSALAAKRRQSSPFPKAFRAGWVMRMACLGLMLASVAFVYALKNTTAANAAFLASVTPLVAVVLARVFIGERLSAVTLCSIAVAFVGLLVMVTADVGGGNLKGNVAALLSSLGFAGYSVCVRSEPKRDWGPVMPGYALLAIVLCGGVTLANGRSLFPPLQDIARAMLHGGVFIVVGTLLFNDASKHIPAVAMTVLAQTETVFVPIWIFLALGERPASTSLIGGGIILAAVVGKAVLDARPQFDPVAASRRVP